MRHGKKSTLGPILDHSHQWFPTNKEWGWLEESPMRKVSKPREPRGRKRFLSDDERQRLLDACRASDSRYLYTVVVLALSTGARKMDHAIFAPHGNMW